MIYQFLGYFIVLSYVRLTLILTPWRSRPQHNVAALTRIRQVTAIPKTPGPPWLPPVRKGPHPLPPCLPLCACMLGSCRDAQGVSTAAAWPVTTSAPSWRFVRRRGSLCAFALPNASSLSPRILSEAWSARPSASERSRVNARLSQCCWPAVLPVPRRRFVRRRGSTPPPLRAARLRQHSSTVVHVGC